MRFANAVLHDLKNLTGDQVVSSMAVVRALYTYLYRVALRRCREGILPTSYPTEVAQSISFFDSMCVGPRGHSTVVRPGVGVAILGRLRDDLQGVPGNISGYSGWRFRRDGSECAQAMAIDHIARLWADPRGGECVEVRVHLKDGVRQMDLLADDPHIVLRSLPGIRLPDDNLAIPEWYMLTRYVGEQGACG